jgi:hypothetical protein
MIAPFHEAVKVANIGMVKKFGCSFDEKDVGCE